MNLTKEDVARLFERAFGKGSSKKDRNLVEPDDSHVVFPIPQNF